MGYKIGEQEYDFWSCKNQDIVSKFVEREVYCCMTSEVEYILSHDDSDAPFTWDDVDYEGDKMCDECGFTDLHEEVDDKTGDDIYVCCDCGKKFTVEEYEGLNSDWPEVYEWWAVSPWLGEKLAQHGGCVIDVWGKSYWGRQATGQAIYLDNIMVQICYDMEILEGQTYEW